VLRLDLIIELATDAALWPLRAMQKRCELLSGIAGDQRSAIEEVGAERSWRGD
jgi:hypothetical protein